MQCIYIVKLYYLFINLSLSLYIYTYIHIHTYIYICICPYLHDNVLLLKNDKCRLRLSSMNDPGDATEELQIKGAALKNQHPSTKTWIIVAY